MRTRIERLVLDDPVLTAGHSGYLGVPLVGLEGGFQGVLAVYSQRPRVWREEEIEALAALAGNASAVLSNAELYQRVAMERERSFAILANIADGIVAVDREGKVVLWNQAAEQITGVPSAAALGRTPLEVLQRELASDDESSHHERLVSVQRGGEEAWLSLTEAVMRDPVGAVSGRIFAFRDVSSERIVEQMKSDFVSTVSHELRAPLTSIYGFAETLLRRDVLFGEAERQTFLGYIASEAQRLTSIVDTLLGVARLEAGDLQVELVPTDLRAVVSEVVTSVQETSDVNGHKFVLHLPDEPLAASADREKLSQILTNLLDNAVKFSPGGGTVTVEAHRRSGNVEVRIVDEGQGIPEAERERIFSKFHRTESSRGAGGAGLGLVHRARPRQRDGRSNLGRLGRRRRLELRLRAPSRSLSRRSRASDPPTRLGIEDELGADSRNRRRGPDPAPLPGEPRGRRDGGARGRGRSRGPGRCPGRACRTPSCST